MIDYKINEKMRKDQEAYMDWFINGCHLCKGNSYKI